MRRRQYFALVRGAPILIACVGSFVVADARAEPSTVYFASADGRTELVGYLFAPKTEGPHPAVVMLHGQGVPIRPRSARDARSSPRTLARPAMPHRFPGGTSRGANIGPIAAILPCLPTALGLETRRTVLAGSRTTIRAATTSTSGPFGPSTRRVPCDICDRAAMSSPINLFAGLVKRREHDAECHVSTDLTAIPGLSCRDGALSGMRSPRPDLAALQDSFAGDGLSRLR